MSADEVSAEIWSRISQRNGWRPISGAPKDGQMVLLLSAGHEEDYETRIRIGFWTTGMHGDAPEPFWADWNTPSEELEWDRIEPTHWMPPPAPPTA